MILLSTFLTSAASFRLISLLYMMLLQNWNEWNLFQDTIVVVNAREHYVETSMIEVNNNMPLTALETKTHNKKYQEYDFRKDFHGIPNNSSYEACLYNTHLLSHVLQNYASYQTLIIPSNYTFYAYSGIYAKNIQHSVLQIDGIIKFERNPKQHEFNVQSPLSVEYHTLPCIMIDLSNNVTITSKYGSPLNNHRGLIDGQGSNYWGIPVIGYLQIGEQRPKLITINQTSNLLIENIVLQDSPYHTLYLEDVTNVTVRNMSIVSRRTTADGHSYVDLSAFNTDGIDVSGNNIHMYNIDIWNQDDCIAVKDNVFNGYSTNMLFENINASGLGFVIGSIGTTIVNNITFSNSYLYKSVKGLYMKFRENNGMADDYERSRSHRSPGTGGVISNIKYENIVIDEPIQWSIWFGPAQQSDSKRLCHANPCSLCWPQIPNSYCNVVKNSYYQNITLSNVTIIRPNMSPGVILGSTVTSKDDSYSTFNDYTYYIGDDETNEMSMITQSLPHIDGVIFHNVKVVQDEAGNHFRGRSLSSQSTSTSSKFLMETFPGLRQPFRDRYVPYRYSHTILEVMIRDLLVPTPPQSRSILYWVVVLVPIGLIVSSIFFIGSWMIRLCIRVCRRMFCSRKRSNQLNDDYRDPLSPTSDLTSPLLTVLHETSHMNFEYLEREQEGQQQLSLNNDSEDDREQQHQLAYELDVTDRLSDPISIPRLRTDTHETVDTTATTETYDTANSLSEVTSLGAIAVPTSKNDSTNKSITRRTVVIFRFFIISTLFVNVLIFILLICNARTRILVRSSFDFSSWGRTPSYQNTNRYYQCTGVVNGIATGDTWPVPHCLQDMTNGRKAANETDP